ncbi:DegT/DnrJ/EryC1/StrS aminotransferase family protein [Frankia sp. CiP3]|uniref:DegT/DnrJ/EryC1/StrS family aminotransferase n=1 Tax=Frankia sp. CiP3 TaxID=2880971 RepID=UPI00210457DE|nr:DegT/DnrJ/EryC1/StrS aminotransferase family protein [Frankia sp. CiP3]
MATSRLAVDGGQPVRDRPYPRWPVFRPEEIATATATMRRGDVSYWTGREGRRFEREFAEAVGACHGVAVANGTVALEIALRVVGVGPGDEVVVPARSTIAPVNCVAALGARPVFADVDAESQTITVDCVRRVLTARTRAVVAVHLAGWPADMDALRGLARTRGLAVIEDCGQAHGATLRGRSVGTRGDIGVWSFGYDRILSTAGEGGMVTTDDAALYRAAWSYKEQGRRFAVVDAGAEPRPEPDGLSTDDLGGDGSDDLDWEQGGGSPLAHGGFGTNARMHELAAAVGRAGLPHLPEMVERRRDNALLLALRLRDVAALRLVSPPSHVGHAYYRWYAFVRTDLLHDGWDRNRVVAAVRAEGVPCFTGCPREVYREAAVPARWRPAASLPVARELGRTAIALLVHPALDLSDISDASDALVKVMSVATSA